MSPNLTLWFILNSGKRANIRTAKKTTTNASKAEDNREARQTEAKMAALREMELETLEEGKRNEILCQTHICLK